MQHGLELFLVFFFTIKYFFFISSSDNIKRSSVPKLDRQ